MCAQQPLLCLDSDLSYLVWRARIHLFSSEEIEVSLDRLKQLTLAQCPANRTACQTIDHIFDERHDEIAALIKQARHNAPTGLVDIVRQQRGRPDLPSASGER